MGAGLSETLSRVKRGYFRDVQLIVVIEEGGLGRILSCFLAVFFFFLAQSDCLLNVAFLGGEMPTFSGSSPLTLLDCFDKVGVGSVVPRFWARTRPSPFVFVTEAGIVIGGSVGHPIPHVSSRPSLFSQPRIVGEQIGDIFGLLTDVCALVLAILVDELELLESLDDVEIVAEIYDDVFRASV